MPIPYRHQILSNQALAKYLRSTILYQDFYVDTFEEEEIVDVAEVQQNIASIKVELAQVQAQMKKYLEELGL